LPVLIVGGVRLKVGSSTVKIDEFVSQLQKLIMANNIDRAIKLCNNTEGFPISQAAKVLLVRADRSEEDIAAAREEAEAEIEIVRAAVDWSTRGQLTFGIGKLGTAALLYVLNPAPWMVVIVVLGLVLSALLLPAYGSLEKSYAEHKHAVIKVYNLVVTRKRGRGDA